MNPFENRYYNLNRKLLAFIGLWPYQKPKERRVRTVIMNIIIAIVATVQMLNAYTLKDDVEVLISSSMFFLPYICIVAAYFVSYVHRKKLKFLLERIYADWMDSKPDELEIIEEYANFGRLCTRILIISFYTPIIVLFILSIMPHIVDDLISPTKRHAYTFAYPMDILIDKEKYPYINILLANLFIVSVSIISLANYTIYLLCVQHICAIFRITGHILEHVITETKHDLSRLIDNSEIYLKITRGIKYHKRALEFTEVLNSISEFCYLLQVVVALIILAIDIMALLQVKNNPKSINMAIFCTMHIAGMLSWLFFNCVLGQKVVDHSFIVFEKTSTIPWYLFPRRIQKLAIILLIRSMKPSYLSIGKMFISSNEFFLSIVQTSVSYGMMLRNV